LDKRDASSPFRPLALSVAILDTNFRHFPGLADRRFYFPE